MKPKQKRLVPGLRVIKTALAVFLCFLIADLRIRFLHQDALAFYSVIACIQAMQKDGESSWSLARSRMLGTLIGAAHGLAVIFVFQAVPMTPQLHYLLLSLITIPLILWTNAAKIPSAAYICCVAFFSVVVTHGMDAQSAPPFAFAMGRVVDTFLGLGVSLVVNLGVPALHPDRRKRGGGEEADGG